MREGEVYLHVKKPLAAEELIIRFGGLERTSWHQRYFCKI